MKKAGLSKNTSILSEIWNSNGAVVVLQNFGFQRTPIFRMTIKWLWFFAYITVIYTTTYWFLFLFSSWALKPFQKMCRMIWLATGTLIKLRLVTHRLVASQFPTQLGSSHFRIAPELDRPYFHETQNVTCFINVSILLGKKSIY